MEKQLPELLRIGFPLVMAPMFLVTNLAMLRAAVSAGILAAFPSLNFRNKGELEKVLGELNSCVKNAPGNYAVNIIVQPGSPYYKKHLDICVRYKVPVYITSLGDPGEVIKAAHAYGALVFCDVTNLAHARKSHQRGCDGFIAIGQGAGGHAGPHPLQVLVPVLKHEFPGKPIVAAGGLATGAGLLSVMALGADGGYMGTRFIATSEAAVSEDYKNAIVKAGMDDIVMTTQLSGTPCSIIDTPQARKMGYSQSWLQKFMSNNPRTKKWFKAWVQLRGMKKLERSVLPNNYERLWTAGKSSALVTGIQSCEQIIEKIKSEYLAAKQLL